MKDELLLIDASIADGRAAEAAARLRHLFYRSPSVLSAKAVSDRYAPKGRLPVNQRCKIWFLRSFTIEPVFPLLRSAALLEGVDLELRAGDFNAYAQEILNTDSEMYRFAPDVVFVMLQSRDVFPAICRTTTVGASVELADTVQRATSDIIDWLAVLRSRTTAVMIVSDFSNPAAIPGGVLGAQAEVDAAALIATANRQLRTFVASTAGTYLLPMSRVIDEMGRSRFYDERKWLMARLPFSAEAMWPVAQSMTGVLYPALGKVRKAVVVDLDNTLWGGIVGEDGLHGVKLGNEYPGAAYTALQRALLECYERGIILAIASKNNEADAVEIIDNHPDMVLRSHHFAARQINWNPKSESLRRIAESLNIGVDSLVFLDDNPVERAQVRGELPEVLVPELPADPMGYVDVVRALAVLERLSVSAEDRDRGRQYAEQRQREDLHRSAGSLEEFYRSLEMAVSVRPVTAATLARTAQLTQKTNQFNLTTRRYDEARLASMLDDPCWRSYTCSVRDKFGDNGLVGVALVRTSEDSWEIDTFLLSCRVIGRTVETGILAKIAVDARKAGVHRLCGCFIETAKNAPAREFYPSHGFACVAKTGGESEWQLDLRASCPAWPDWLGEI
jgi:FkbH-like protein